MSFLVHVQEEQLIAFSLMVSFVVIVLRIPGQGERDSGVNAKSVPG